MIAASTARMQELLDHLNAQLHPDTQCPGALAFGECPIVEGSSATDCMEAVVIAWRAECTALRIAEWTRQLPWVDKVVVSRVEVDDTNEPMPGTVCYDLRVFVKPERSILVHRLDQAGNRIESRRQEVRP